MTGSVLIVSGPSGAGKSSLVKEILNHIPNAVFSISTTTRKPREGEIHGVNYFFTDKESFQKDIDDEAFLEWANVHDNFYGTSIKQIMEYLKNGKLVILDIDVQGYMIAKKKLGNFITSVFITTKDKKSLENRLILRQSDAKDTINTRLENAKKEMTYINEYEYLIINDDFNIARNAILSIAASSIHKCTLVDKEEFISSWFKN
ncbi:MAG: guanylate kinase [Campylobacteraceae bacterium]|nr:guanylate kinase [Campylobacteraceae bacterium]